MSYRIDSLPGGHMKKADVFQAMYDAARMEAPLPEGMQVTWQWQNTPTQDWREEDFETVVSESNATRSSGFVNLMLGRIRRDAAAAGVDLEHPELREATPEEIEEIEEAIEEQEEDVSIERRRGQGTIRKEEREKRSAAAKRAAETRRKRKEHERRSAAAKRGWITRRKHEAQRKRKRSKR
jgi:hypothetical protein